jgi:1-acyl-sn-glycerol-3-phosphate acyltransferase
LSHQDQKKAFHEPPIQSRHWGYSLALQLVRSAVTRFHRIEGIDGIENITEPKTPTIVVANHQNGLMDPLVVVSLISNSQVHWLTRADIFYKKLTRNILFAFNQMPIFRQRDRLSDARERNNRIFEICAERIRIGGRMGLFPEGNHRSMKSLRPLRRGVSDMVNASIALDSSMRNLKILPVGIDYEEFPSFRRRLRYRVGKPIEIDSLIDPETNEVSPGSLLTPLSEALDELLVNIQPEEAYAQILPYVQAMRTTECDDWGSQQRARSTEFQDARR